jgi:protein-disulfide isomerase
MMRGIRSRGATGVWALVLVLLGAAAAGWALAAVPGEARPGPAPQEVIDLRRVGYERGSPDAPIVVVEFSDFGCPFCGQIAREHYPVLHKEFVQTGRVRWRYVPVVLGIFPNGEEAARAAECAAEQGRFWYMHDKLYERQREWRGSRGVAELLAGYAEEVGVEPARFASCYAEDRGAARRRASGVAAQQLGVRATPTFLINGRRIEGALPLEQFRQLLSQ